MTALARLLSAQGYDCITAEEKERGRQFDAELLDLFFGSFDDVRAIRRSADTANAEQMFARALAHVSARARSQLEPYSASGTSRTLATSARGEKGLMMNPEVKSTRSDLGLVPAENESSSARDAGRSPGRA